MGKLRVQAETQAMQEAKLQSHGSGLMKYVKTRHRDSALVAPKEEAFAALKFKHGEAVPTPPPKADGNKAKGAFNSHII